MSVILSLQGCMAAGKTTAARYVENNMKNVFVSYENLLLYFKKLSGRDGTKIL